MPLASRISPSLATAAVAALALGAVALLPASDGTTPGHTPDAAGQAAAPFEVRHASFTLVRNADGSITFTALQLVDTAAATQALNGAGITGRVLTGDPPALLDRVVTARSTPPTCTLPTLCAPSTPAWTPATR
jgi:hypothetical protein